jgi:GNAT superfamily N-acetyltransferase
MDHWRLHRNLIAVSSVDDGERVERDGEVLYASESPLPYMNFAARTTPSGNAAAFLQRATAFFADRRRGFVVYAWPGDPAIEHAALDAGFVEVMRRYPEMVRRTPMAELPGDVRRVETEEQGAAYWRICDVAYPAIGIPEDFFTPLFPASTMLPRTDREACLGYLDGEPVACASVFLAEGVGMICWVGSLPEARGKGLAAACTAWATNHAFALGADVAALQASVMGEPVYARMGYEEAYPYRLLGFMPG